MYFKLGSTFQFQIAHNLLLFGQGETNSFVEHGGIGEKALIHGLLIHIIVTSTERKSDWEDYMQT